MQSEQPIKVLYVDDENSNLTGFKAHFRRHYQVFTALSADEARVILSLEQIHVLITDHKMPGTNGVQLLEEVVKENPLPTRIMMTAYADNSAIFDAFHKGFIYQYVLKPWDNDNLKTLIDRAYEVYKLNRIKESLYEEWLKTNKELELMGIK